MTGPLSILRIEVDGHHHGGPPLKPWVAEITGTCPRYGLAREFVRAMNDWRDARKAWSGNVYGKVATFPLREGRLYEIARARGRSSRRYLAREFYIVERGKRVRRTPDEALAIADGGGPATLLKVDEPGVGESERTWVARVTGLGTPERLGFVLVDGERWYRLRVGVHEVVEAGARRLVGVRDSAVLEIDEQEAMAWLSSST